MKKVSITVRFKEILENRKHSDKVRDSIFGMKQYEAWLAQFYLLADTQYHIYQENTALLDSILSEFYDEDAPLEKYEELYQCVRMLKEMEYYDPGLEEELLSILIPYYEINPDIDKLIYLYASAGNTYMELSRTGDYDFGEMARTYLEKQVLFRNDQAAMQKPDNVINVLVGYANLTGAALSLSLISFKDAYEHWKNLQVFAKDLKIEQMVNENEKVRNYLSLATNVFSKTAFCIYMNEKAEEPEIYPVILELAKHQYFDGLVTRKEIMDPYNEDFYIYHYLLVETEKESVEKAFWEMNSFYTEHKNIDLNRVAEEEFLSVGLLINPIFYIISMLERTCLPKEEKKRIILSYKDEILKIADKFSMVDASFTVNTALNEVASNEILFSAIDTPADKINFLAKLTISRQISTLIHSTMVSRLVEMVLTHILEHKPELLLSVDHCDTIEQVLEHKDELLNYAIEAAILHDIGKNAMIDIINTSYRRLTEAEALIIKNHPLRGCEYIKVDPYFKKYYDVILGHHKYYDGSGGYDTAFDNTTSKYRFLIDLITICDCMDAATDYLARNFRSAKIFETLFEELEAGAGTIYNPEIVSYLKECPKLLEELKYTLGPGRTEIYYQIYLQYM